MPTTRPRFQVTETEAVARALAVAERHWPGLGRSELATKLFEAGAEAIEAEDAARRAEWLRIVEETAGVVGDETYPPGYLAELRAEWPE